MAISNKLAKLVQMPEFKPLPPSTDLANVQENMDLWINKGMEEKLKNYTKLDFTKKRVFVTSYDFYDIKLVSRKVKKLDVILRFTRKVHTPDHFCPLHFVEWYTEIELIDPVSMSGIEINSAAQLEREAIKYYG